MNLLLARTVCNIARHKVESRSMPKTARKAGLLIIVAAMLAVSSAVGQEQAESVRPEVRVAPGDFLFVRLAYSANRYGRGGGWGRGDR